MDKKKQVKHRKKKGKKKKKAVCRVSLLVETFFATEVHENVYTKSQVTVACLLINYKRTALSTL